MSEVITEKQDLTYLNWSHVRTSSGTAGTFLKSESGRAGNKTYYKLSNYDSELGVVGHECVNELIADRLLEILGVEHLSYTLIHADINLSGKIYETWLCESKDFKARGESKAALDDFYQANREGEESRYEFCIKMGWQEYIETMLAIDFIILNRDRHGANIEVLRNAKKKNLRLAPVFDHGVSLLYSCRTPEEVRRFDVLEDKPCQNFIGGRSTLKNLEYIRGKGNVFPGTLKETDRERLFQDLSQVLPAEHLDKIWEMLWKRWSIYENICNDRS